MEKKIVEMKKMKKTKCKNIQTRNREQKRLKQTSENNKIVFDTTTTTTRRRSIGAWTAAEI